MADPFEQHSRRPLSEHLEDYGRFLEGKGDSAKHVSQTVSRVQSVLDGCNFNFIADLNASRVVQCLADLRRTGRGISTSNGYLTAIKGLSRWLMRDGRACQDPLAHLSRLNADSDIRRERRPLDNAELQTLLSATGASMRTFRGLTGTDRRMLYALAMTTGLRVSELASLKPSNFDLAALGSPTVTVEAGYAKNKKEANQPLPRDVAIALRVYLAARQTDQPVWPGTWREKSAKMLRQDMAAARTGWISAAANDAERKRREESDFLAYRDRCGRVIDFHGLRHSFITLLERSGVSPKRAQELARHSDIRLTMNVYTHPELCDLAAAANSLPPLLGDDSSHALQHALQHALAVGVS
jgi:integrase